MRVKRSNLELVSGLNSSSFILNYMLIRVKEERFGIRKTERTERRGRNDRERGSNEKEEKREEEQSFGNLLA